MGKIVCLSNCIHRGDGDCKLDYTAITRDTTSVLCFEYAADPSMGEAGEETMAVPEMMAGPEDSEDLMAGLVGSEGTTAGPGSSEDLMAGLVGSEETMVGPEESEQWRSGWRN